MTSALQFEDTDVSLQKIVDEGFAGARQGAVLAVEVPGIHFTRARRLQRQLIDIVPEGVVYARGNSLFVILVRNVAADECWLWVERIRRELAHNGWELALVSSASWSAEGATPMDGMTAALTSVARERIRLENDLGFHEAFMELEGNGFNWVCAGEFLSG